LSESSTRFGPPERNRKSPRIHDALRVVGNVDQLDGPAGLRI
jgi:hypothetical protein